MRIPHRALRGLPLTLLLAAGPAGAGEFLDVRDENPLLRGLYLPMPVQARAADGASLDAALAIANTINVEARGGEHLFVDGEALVIRLGYEAPLAPRWRLRLNLPLIRDSGGALDRLIDRWHGWFGLPRGDRPNHPRNQLDYAYLDRSGTPGPRLAQSHSGIGDAAAELGWYAIDTPAHTLSVWAGVEAPTGSAGQLSGDGAWDAALWLQTGWRGRRWDLGGEAGLLRRADLDNEPETSAPAPTAGERLRKEMRLPGV